MSYYLCYSCKRHGTRPDGDGWAIDMCDGCSMTRCRLIQEGQRPEDVCSRYERKEEK